jgi:hypothetical protein
MRPMLHNQPPPFNRRIDGISKVPRPISVVTLRCFGRSPLALSKRDAIHDLSRQPAIIRLCSTRFSPVGFGRSGRLDRVVRTLGLYELFGAPQPSLPERGWANWSDQEDYLFRRATIAGGSVQRWLWTPSNALSRRPCIEFTLY